MAFLSGAPSGFRTPDPLIKSGRFALLPAVSCCVPYFVGRQWIVYLTTSCRGRSIPADCASFATHKRHLAVSALANLLRGAEAARKQVGECPGDRKANELADLYHQIRPSASANSTGRETCTMCPAGNLTTLSAFAAVTSCAATEASVS